MIDRVAEEEFANIKHGLTRSMAAPTAHPPSFCERRTCNAVTLSPDIWNPLDGNRFS
jgi:hypothetical protein